jgi:hypothetical protein
VAFGHRRGDRRAAGRRDGAAPRRPRGRGPSSSPRGLCASRARSGRARPRTSDTNAALVHVAFARAQKSVCAADIELAAVVGGEDDQRIVAESGLLQCLDDAALAVDRWQRTPRSSASAVASVCSYGRSIPGTPLVHTPLPGTIVPSAAVNVSCPKFTTTLTPLAHVLCWTPRSSFRYR